MYTFYQNNRYNRHTAQNQVYAYCLQRQIYIDKQRRTRISTRQTNNAEPDLCLLSTKVDIYRQTAQNQIYAICLKNRYNSVDKQRKTRCMPFI